MKSEIIHGDCLEKLKDIPSNSIDSIVTDPPYGIAFMNKAWDYDVPSVAIWKECMRVLKPGGYLLSFSGTRTYHVMTMRIENAGFWICDMISWIYGSGFPKSHDVSKGIDKAAGAEREIVGVNPSSRPNSKRVSGKEPGGNADGKMAGVQSFTAPATEAAKQWQGWGTALKPAQEPICLAQKPLAYENYAFNVQKFGTGALNIDASRIAGSKPDTTRGAGGQNGKLSPLGAQGRIIDDGLGRWPANILFDEEAAAVLDEMTEGTRASKPSATGTKFKAVGAFPIENENPVSHNDSGGASRFFYVAKASKAERNRGLEGMPKKQCGALNMRTDAHSIKNAMNTEAAANNHPTVKPIKLMEYLIKLVTPPDGTVLDPFNGSGATGCAAALLGFDYIGIERELEYVEIARRRIEHWSKKEASNPKKSARKKP